MKNKKLLNVVTYLAKHYPEPSHLSNARLTKMVFLGDWHHTLHCGEQITRIRWYFDNYGPFVWDVKNVVEEYPCRFDVVSTRNMFGTEKTEIRLKSAPDIRLAPSESKSLDHVIEQTSKLNWSDFIRLVYSTHPISSSQRYTYLDLSVMAKEYQTRK